MEKGILQASTETKTNAYFKVLLKNHSKSKSVIGKLRNLCEWKRLLRMFIRLASISRTWTTKYYDLPLSLLFLLCFSTRKLFVLNTARFLLITGFNNDICDWFQQHKLLKLILDFKINYHSSFWRIIDPLFPLHVFPVTPAPQQWKTNMLILVFFVQLRDFCG